MNPFEIQENEYEGINEEILTAIFEKGKILFMDGNYEESLNEFEEALRLG